MERHEVGAFPRGPPARVNQHAARSIGRRTRACAYFANGVTQCKVGREQVCHGSRVVSAIREELERFWICKVWAHIVEAGHYR